MVWIFLCTFIVLNITFLLFFWVIYFLSGFGFILNIAFLFLFICDKIKENISKRGVTCLIITQLLILIIINIYAIYRIYSSFLGKGGLLVYGILDEGYAWIDNIIYLFSIISLLTFLYINPILKKKFKDTIVQGRAIIWKFRAKTLGREIKKKYYCLRSKYSKIQLQNQMTGQELLKSWQNKLAAFFLIFLALATLIFTPIAFLCIVFWLKIFIFDQFEIKKYEKIAFLISIIIIGTIAFLGPFFNLYLHKELANLLWTVNIFYFLGVFFASILYVKEVF